MWTILTKLGLPQALVAAAIAASGAWYVTHKMDLADYRALQIRVSETNAAAQREALAAKEKSEAELADAAARAAAAARTLTAERAKAAATLHQSIGAINDVSLRACLAMPIPSGVLNSLPR